MVGGTIADERTVDLAAPQLNRRSGCHGIAEPAPDLARRCK
jgi:hypothetical protein